MRNLLFLILFGILFSSNSTAQNQELVKRMELSMLKEQHDSVRVIASLILQTDSANWLAHYYLGKMALSDYNYFEAISHFENANASDTANSVIENALADSYDFIGKDEMAINIYYNQYLRDTLSLEPIVKLANIFRKKNEYGSAIYYYQKAVAINPTNFFYYKQLALCYDKINVQVGAILSYQTAIMLNPYDASLYIQLANIFNTDRAFLDAIKTCKKGLTQYPNNAQLLKLQSYAYYLNRDFDSSIVGFDKLLQLGDSSYFNLKYQGLALFEKKEFERAANNLLLAKEYNDEDAETFFYLGSALGRSSNGDDGFNYLNKSKNLLEPSPVELANIFSEMAYILQDQEKYELALEYLKTAYKYNATPVLSFKMAQLYDYFLKNKKLAINYYDGYLIMVNPTKTDVVENKTDHESSSQDSAMIQNANERIRILKEDLFFEETNKK